MADKIVRVAVYARVSTQEQAVEGTSLDHQQEPAGEVLRISRLGDLSALCRCRLYGKDDNRPGLQRLLADAKLGLFEKVAVFKLDRLSRNLRLLLEIEERLKEYSAALFSIKELIDTSFAIGRTVFQVLGLVSEWERDAIIERTKAGRLQRYKEGCWAGGRNPYGYDYDKATKKLVINKEQAAVIKRIYQLYSNGKSMAYIANNLNGEKIPPRDKSGKGWRSTAIRDILANPTFKGTQYVNHGLHISKLLKEKPESAIEIKVPRIVSDAMWKSAQEHRKNNRHLQPMHQEPWLLSGLITCGLCGHAFMIQPNHGRRTYNCRGRLRATHLDSSPKCTVKNLDADCLEEKVWSRVKEITGDSNKLKSVIEETIESLKNRDVELFARIRPVNDELSRIQAHHHPLFR